MKTKRFILMLLVMLGSVTGAWATDTGSDNLSAMCLETQNIKVTPAGVLDLTHIPEVVIWEYNNKTKIEAKNDVKIKQIILQACTGVGIPYGVSASGASEIINDVEGFYTINFTNGVTSTIIGPGNGHPDYAKLFAVAIYVAYEYPDHTHSYAGNWTYDDECHWHECTSLIGLCKDNQGSKAPHNYGDSGEAYYTCQTCGYVNEQRKHVHVPADTWSYDAIQHWHACTSAVGTCDANGKLDLANHTYGSSMYGEEASVYYTCTVCGYVDNTRKAQYDALDFLSMKALDAPMTIGMTKTGSPADYDLQYSLDRTHWTTVALTATNSNIVEIPAGQTCYFRHGTETAIDRISKHQDHHWAFTMTGDGSVEAGGNVMSLLDITCQKNTLSAQHVFNSLFKGCAKLTKAPKLPATSLGEYCYWSMFEGTSITEVPELPATSVRTGSYLSMFKDCKQLTSITGGNVLSFTSLERRACKEMFKGCEKLTSVTLNNITSMDSRSDSDASFYNWLEGTAIDEEGVLIAPDALVGNPLIFLPQNWMFKQIKDYTTAVSNATEGTASVIQSIGEDYIQQIKQATSNASALSLRDEALNDINLLKKYNAQIVERLFSQPTQPGMRMVVTKKAEGTNPAKVYEFDTRDIESVEYREVTE